MKRLLLVLAIGAGCAPSSARCDTAHPGLSLSIDYRGGGYHQASLTVDFPGGAERYVTFPDNGSFSEPVIFPWPDEVSPGEGRATFEASGTGAPGCPYGTATFTVDTSACVTVTLTALQNAQDAGVVDD
jgi:hypothetical protein